MTTDRNSIIYAGKDFPLPQKVVYEKTSSNDEYVAGRILSYGTAVSQLKLYVANSKAVAVARYQVTYPGTYLTYPNKAYAHDGKPIDHAAFGPFIFVGNLNTGNSVANGAPLQAEATTGKLDAQSTGSLVAYALATSDASSADDDDFLALFVGNTTERWITETLTVTTNVGTLTYVPTLIEYIEATAGTRTGGVVFGETVTTPANAGQAYLARSSKTITFYATDAVSQCKVRYQF